MQVLAVYCLTVENSCCSCYTGQGFFYNTFAWWVHNHLKYASSSNLWSDSGEHFCETCLIKRSSLFCFCKVGGNSSLMCINNVSNVWGHWTYPIVNNVHIEPPSSWVWQHITFSGVIHFVGLQVRSFKIYYCGSNWVLFNALGCLIWGD